MLEAVDLSAVEQRVLGCLLEKELTTPQQYPLTLNALLLACNQASNRDPVVDLDEQTVERAVTSVKTRGLAGFVHPSHGRSALRFRHTLDEALGLGTAPLALLAVLLLRGPQTLGELRTRTERMVTFSDLAEVQAELDALAGRAEPLVVRLARAPGQKEERFAHLLGQDDLRTAVPGARTAPPGVAHHPTAPAAPAGPPAPGLAQEVAALRAEVASLRRDVDDLRQQLGV